LIRETAFGACSRDEQEYSRWQGAVDTGDEEPWYGEELKILGRIGEAEHHEMSQEKNHVLLRCVKRLHADYAAVTPMEVESRASSPLG